jgi:hypothetical protein
MTLLGVWIRIMLPDPDPNFSSWIRIPPLPWNTWRYPYEVPVRRHYGIRHSKVRYTSTRYSSTCAIQVHLRGTLHLQYEVQSAIEVQPHLWGFVHLWTVTRYNYTYQVQLHLYTYEVHLKLLGISTVHLRSTLTTRSYIYNEKLHLQLGGTVHLHSRGTSTPARYIYTNEIHLQLDLHWSAPTMYIYPYEIHLQLRVTFTPTMYSNTSWNSLQIWPQTVRKYDASTDTSDVQNCTG